MDWRATYSCPAWLCAFEAHTSTQPHGVGYVQPQRMPHTPQLCRCHLPQAHWDESLTHAFPVCVHQCQRVASYIREASEAGLGSLGKAVVVASVAGLAEAPVPKL